MLSCRKHPCWKFGISREISKKVSKYLSIIIEQIEYYVEQKCLVLSTILSSFEYCLSNIVEQVC